MEKILKNKKGFTLIETIIYIGILAMVITSIVSYSLTLSGAKNKNYVIENAQANSRTFLNIVSEKIREASSITTPSAGASSNQLVLNMGASTITFSLSNGRLVMAQTGNPDLYITDTRVAVTDFVLTNNASSGERDDITIQATVSSNVAAGDVENGYTQQLSTSVTRRN